jgi:hypothetical protein
MLAKHARWTGSAWLAESDFRRVGLTIDVQTTGRAPSPQRRPSKEPLEKGGWSLFPSAFPLCLQQPNAGRRHAHQRQGRLDHLARRNEKTSFIVSVCHAQTPVPMTFLWVYRQGMTTIDHVGQPELPIGQRIACRRCKGSGAVYYARIPAEIIGGKRIQCPECGGVGRLDLANQLFRYDIVSREKKRRVNRRKSAGQQLELT